MKPFLYLEPEGTLLLESDHPDHFLDAGIVPYAKPFLAWATKHFQVRWLTDRPPAHVFHLAEALNIPGHEIPFASFTDSKADAIKPNSNFYWVDSRLTPMDISWLAQHGKTDRLLAVSNPAGITEGHKEWLEDKLAGKRR